jgi:hypothetical protein
MKELRNIPAYIKALKYEIAYLTQEMETVEDSDVLYKIDVRICKMYNLIVALEKMQTASNDVEDLEKELFND